MTDAPLIFQGDCLVFSEACLHAWLGKLRADKQLVVVRVKAVHEHTLGKMIEVEDLPTQSSAIRPGGAR